MKKRKKTTKKLAVEKPSTIGKLQWLTVVGARQNNLRDITVDFPLQRFVCVTGVSGSGKSSLVNDILREALARDLNESTKAYPGEHDAIKGIEHLDKVIDIDQSPIGRTPRSNPATYIKVFDEIRALYAKLPDSRVRGYKPGRFSFNVNTGAGGGGRCEACEGNGSNKMEMELLADVWVICPVCTGHRFSKETLQILFKGKNITDVLDMDVQDALKHFESVPKIAHMLRTLHDVGLDYLKLGQSSTTLSGGEAQRIKLARELVKRSTGRTLYILDEPTTGLHFADIKKLLAVLHGFVDAGNSVVVIEHNLDVVKTADWVIDLGPDGGVHGGRIVVTGTPEQIAKKKNSYTGQALCDVLNVKSTKRKSIKKNGKLKNPATNGRNGVIQVVGARQHNLKDITVDIPRNKTTVCCGPSGSGKSSFAIDTLYAEGQRRYVESLSSYARQFLGRLQPPKVDHVYGLSPSICIEQKNTSKSPRSTVGTVTEIYDYMRVLWTRIGQPYCPACTIPVGTQTADEIVQRLLDLGEGKRIILLAPVEAGVQESFADLFVRERANGYARVRVDGVIYSLDDTIQISTKKNHLIELVVDRVVIHKRQLSRLTDSVEQALKVGQGVLIALDVTDEKEKPTAKSNTNARQRKIKRANQNKEFRFSQFCSCEQCGRSFDEMTPHHFSFNTRMGWCEACEGLGVQLGASPSAIVVHPTRSLIDGAIGAWGEVKPGSKMFAIVNALADHIGFDVYTPWNKLSETHRMAMLHGCKREWISVKSKSAQAKACGSGKSNYEPAWLGMRFRWRGFFPTIDRATRSSWQYRKRLEDLVTDVACDACAGSRLKSEPAAVQLAGATLHEVCLRSLGQALKWFEKIKLDTRQKKIAGELLHEITSRLRFLVEVGLEYVSLHRTASTLSGGEAQRIQLASQIGTGLTGVLYVLDEPTIGLHPRDNDRLIGAMNRLRDLGNTLLLVEHDRDVIDSADHVLDFGPGAGVFGGEITAAQSPKRLRTARNSLTGKYLSNRVSIPVPSNRRAVSRHLLRTDLELDEGISTTRQGMTWLTVHSAREHNLKEIDVSFPLGRFTCVTGVSGSGKSTLVSNILYNALASRLHRARLVAGGHDRITGVEYIDKVINVDQSPIGLSPTSNPATYTGVFDVIRELFAKLPMSKIRGYSVNRFSFNRAGGRCEACEGMGQRCIEMHFLPDVWVECESCGGQRYVPETLEVQYRGKSISDVLNMRVSEALELFYNIPKVRRMLQTLDDVGLGYVQLGQSAPTLSGGEAQRVKLATELGKPSTGQTLYILDEPTTGLHFDDLKKLLNVLHRLVDLGNTVICIEHNLDVIKTADWMIDLGPEAGEAGGEIVAVGHPEDVIKSKKSYTARALKPVLQAGPIQERQVFTPDQISSRETLQLDQGEEVSMPWESDGKAWHSVDRVDRSGVPVDWDPQVLLWLVETIESSGKFDATDWEHRTRIEMNAPGSQPWFCHIFTSGKDLLEIALRVKQGSFDENELNHRLKIKTLDDRKDLPIYGQWDRVRLRNNTAGWEIIRLYVRDFKDIHKAKFRALLKEAADSYFSQIHVEQVDPGKSKPWKNLGMEWHLSQKSILRRHPIRWKPTLLMALLGKFKSLQPDLEIDWNSKTAGRFLLPGRARTAGKIVTNMGRGLRVELYAPKNSITPTRIEKLGEEPEIKPQPDQDRIVFWVRDLKQIDTAQLRDVWNRCRRLESNEESDQKSNRRLQSA